MQIGSHHFGQVFIFDVWLSTSKNYFYHIHTYVHILALEHWANSSDFAWRKAQARCPTNKLKSVKFGYCFEKHVVFYL